jgi:hypothetical protein
MGRNQMTWTQAVRAMRKGHKVKRQEWNTYAGHLWISLKKVDARKDGFGVHEGIISSQDLKDVWKSIDDVTWLPCTATFHMARAMQDTLETDWEITE